MFKQNILRRLEFNDETQNNLQKKSFIRSPRLK